MVLLEALLKRSAAQQRRALSVYLIVHIISELAEEPEAVLRTNGPLLGPLVEFALRELVEFRHELLVHAP